MNSPIRNIEPSNEGQENRLQSLEDFARDNSAAVAGLVVKVEGIGNTLEKGLESIGKKIDSTNQTLSSHDSRLLRMERHVDADEKSTASRKDFLSKALLAGVVGLVGFFVSDLWRFIHSWWPHGP